MKHETLDLLVVMGYFAALVFVGFWKGKGKQASSGAYFFSRGTLPWWAIGCAYVATGMNTEQLVGQNGMGYTVGLTVVNWYYTIAPVVYTALIFFFFPVYLRNRIHTLPEYLGRRFDDRSKNVFALLLLVSYVLLNLAVVFYGGAKVLQGVFGWNLWGWLLVLALVSGIYTMYGGMSSMVYTAVLQFLLIFVSGFVVFLLGYLKLPNGWADVVQHAPGGFHLMQPMDYDVIPWHAIPLTLLGLHLFYSCTNQAMVQRGFGARTEWDVRIAVVFVGFALFFRPFIEIFPGMIARALAFTGHPEFDLGVTRGEPVTDVDAVFPMLINGLIPTGWRGLIVAGILASIMSTISALLNSIATLFTYDVYKKWIRKDAGDRDLVRVGAIATLVLMAFGVVYSPAIGAFGGIFRYFQAAASCLAVPIATVFLFGLFWRRATPTAAFTVMVAGIPIGLVVAVLLGGIALGQVLPSTAAYLPLFSQEAIDRYSLDNFFVQSGITQAICCALMVCVSLVTPARPAAEARALMWSKPMLRLPADEPRRPLLSSVGFWWSLFILFYACVIAYLW
jgi:SSS family solute:Na+ symporter